MFNNYVKVAFRNIAKYRLFSSINIFGLAIGISTCMMIYFWVQQELSYDSFHKNGHRIYYEDLINGVIKDERELCNKVVTIDGKQYKLKEI